MAERAGCSCTCKSEILFMNVITSKNHHIYSLFHTSAVSSRSRIVNAQNLVDFEHLIAKCGMQIGKRFK